MAAFYADASPVRVKLDWESGPQLAFIGMQADVMGAGCAFEGVKSCWTAFARTCGRLNESDACSSGTGGPSEVQLTAQTA